MYQKLFSFYILNFNSYYLKTVVSPTTKLHIAILVIEWEPRDVDLTCTFEDTRWHIQARTVVPHHHVCLIGAVEFFISTVKTINKTSYNTCCKLHSNILGTIMTIIIHEFHIIFCIMARSYQQMINCNPCIHIKNQKGLLQKPRLKYKYLLS